MIASPSKSAIMVGIAVDTIVPSIADIKVVIKTASVTIFTFVFFILFPNEIYVTLMSYVYSIVKNITCGH